MTDLSKPKRVYAAIWMLYSSSILGLIHLLTVSIMVIQPKIILWSSLFAYIMMIAMVFLISIKYHLAKIFYMIIAALWYGISIFYFPEKYNHTPNSGLIFIEILLIISGLLILYQLKSLQWFKDHKHSKKTN